MQSYKNNSEGRCRYSELSGLGNALLELGQWGARACPQGPCVPQRGQASMGVEVAVLGLPDRTRVDSQVSHVILQPRTFANGDVGMSSVLKCYLGTWTDTHLAGVSNQRWVVGGGEAGTQQGGSYSSGLTGTPGHCVWGSLLRPGTDGPAHPASLSLVLGMSPSLLHACAPFL